MQHKGIKVWKELKKSLRPEMFQHQFNKTFKRREKGGWKTKTL